MTEFWSSFGKLAPLRAVLVFLVALFLTTAATYRVGHSLLLEQRTEILRGSVLSNLDEMCEWGEEDNEQLNRMKVSDVEGDVNVSGVFQAWDDDDDTYTNDFYCAMTGDFVIRIAQGTTVARGDLLMSAGDGTAKPQDDDIVRSKTIAKVTSTTVSTTYSDGSYCIAYCADGLLIIHSIFYLLTMSTITWKVAQPRPHSLTVAFLLFTTPLMHALMTKCILPVLMVLLVLERRCGYSVR